MTGPHKDERLFYSFLAYNSSAVKLQTVYDDDILYCDPNDVEVTADKIDRLLNDKELGATLIKARDRRPKNFGFRKSAKSQIDIIEGLN